MPYLLLLLLALPTLALAQSPPEATLAERLGYGAGDRLLIVNGDDLAMSHAANAASFDALERGLMTSASIMVPAPWFPEAAAYARAHPEADFGLHLTHTSEWKGYRWGPVASKDDVPGLVDPQGYLWPDVQSVYRHAAPEEAYLEGKAQIEKALAAGIDVTHLDSHMGALQYDLGFYEAYRRLAREYDLPLRMGSQEVLAVAGVPHLRRELAQDGVVSPDYLIHDQRRPGEPITDYWKRVLQDLPPGVTELYIHAALPGEEMRHITHSWQERAEEYRLFTTDPEIRRLLEAQDVKRIGYRELRDLQREKR